MGTRGPYAKGVAKRQEIIEAALHVIGRDGYSNATVRQIADEVGLSQNGMLHYFDSKDALFVEVLRRRDQIDVEEVTHVADFRAEWLPASSLAEFQQLLLTLIRHNAEVSGLVHLFARLSADAAEPEHAAHEFFRQRYLDIRSSSLLTMRKLQERGEVRADVDLAKAVVMLFAVMDGLQTQWMYDPEVDMAVHVEAFIDLLRPPAGASSSATEA